MELGQTRGAYGARTSRYDVPNQWRQYDIDLVLSERAEGADADSDYNESDIFTNRFPVSIVATDSTIPQFLLRLRMLKERMINGLLVTRKAPPFLFPCILRIMTMLTPKRIMG